MRSNEDRRKEGRIINVNVNGGTMDGCKDDERRRDDFNHMRTK